MLWATRTVAATQEAKQLVHSRPGAPHQQQLQQPSLWAEWANRWCNLATWQPTATKAAARHQAAAGHQMSSVQEGYHAAMVHTSSTREASDLNVEMADRHSNLQQPPQGALLEDFVAPADAVELNYAALLADLCDLAYDPTGLKADDLSTRHQLQLVTSSLQVPYGPLTRDAWEAKATAEQRRKTKHGSKLQAQQLQEHHAAPDSNLMHENLSAAAQPDHTVRLTADLHGRMPPVRTTAAGATAAGAGHAGQAPKLSGLAAAVAQAVFAEEATQAHLMSHGDQSPRLTPSVSLVSLSSLDSDGGQDGTSTTTTVPVIAFLPSPSSPNRSSMHSADIARELDVAMPSWEAQEKSLISSGSAAATGEHNLQAVQLPVLTYESMAQAQEELTSSQAGALASSEPPAAWFACDDPVTHIRYFVIQGSTTLEHWQINLQFEPVIFEDPALGVRVHRGVYMAALRLYDELVPVVRQHLASSPLASVTFTGHSLGGSLATVLMLLMVSRGVLPPNSVSPTYTFGAPAVFCGGAARNANAARCESCALDCPMAGTARADNTAQPHQAMPATSNSNTQGLHEKCMLARSRGLFAAVGLGEEHIVNVIMHRDIVPRAFACDYSTVADLLTQWMPSFATVAGQEQGPGGIPHRSLYTFLGRLAVLQPDPGCSFANPSDAFHPHLPRKPALFRLVAPAPRLKVHSLHGSFDIHLPASSQVSLDEATSSLDEAGGQGSVAKAPRNLKQAVIHFLNNPHPLTTLSEYGSYGPNGSISRYHNPRNYTLALLSLVGKAPHQVRPAPSALNMPTQLSPACPLPGQSTVTDADLTDLQQLCMASNGLHELAVSPEALRLVKQPASPVRKAKAVKRLAMIRAKQAVGVVGTVATATVAGLTVASVLL